MASLPVNELDNRFMPGAEAGDGPDTAPEIPISQLREEIDAIDDEILGLINRRLTLAQEIGRAKARKGSQVIDKAREIRILNRLSGRNAGPLADYAVKQIFAQIMAASKDLQTSQRVSYLGPEATFTHIATMKHFGLGVSLIPQPSIRDVFKEVEKGACHYGVVPVENSIEGAVNHTLDLFFESDLKICAEIYQTISHDLLSGSASLNEIRTVFSHPQAFAQCREWLRKYLPDAERVECNSTSDAARRASNTPDTAAISSSEAAAMYHLQVLASRIEDTARNTTRFLIIGHDEVHRTGEDKTSLMFVTSHIPGALYKVLKPLADSGINMVKLESRPTKHENWSYFFFADVEGHLEDRGVSETIDRMGELCLFLKWLGSYPKTQERGER